MRTIKFRGKVLYTQEWVYGSLEVFSDDNKQYARIKFDKPYTDEELGITIPVGHDYLVDPETVGQFTGLYDKNGKEIYEGDVLNVWLLPFSAHEEKPVTVVWNTNEACFILVIDEKTKSFYRFQDIMESEVIRNIHDGKEEAE